MALTYDIDEEELRAMVRISSDDLDDELLDLKEAFLLDLSRDGVEILPENLALVKVCLRLYLRWHQNYNGEAERYMEHYKELRDALSLASEYKDGDSE